MKIDFDSLDAISAFEGKLSNSFPPRDSDWEDQLNSWCAQQDWLGIPIVRTIEIENDIYYRTSVSLDKSASLEHGAIIGCGRDKSPRLSLTKAYAETIERLIAAHAIRQNLETAKQRLHFEENRFSIGSSSQIEKFNWRLYNTTNGWAVHRTPEAAILSAFQEAAERHLLILSFAFNGWNSFKKTGEGQVLGKQVLYYVSQVRQCGFEAKLVCAKLKNHSGVTFGFQISSQENEAELTDFRKATFEAIEPATAFDHLSSSDLEDIATTAKDPLDRIQAHWAKSPFQEFTHLGLERNIQVPLTANFVTFDVAKLINSPMPHYAAFIGQGSLLPLAQGSALNEIDAAACQSVLETYQPFLRFPDAHPII